MAAKRTVLKTIHTIFWPALYMAVIVYLALHTKALFHDIANASHNNPLYIIIALACFSLTFPIAALIHKILLKEKISLVRLTAVQLAAASAGRIIPAGAGSASITALYLKKNHVSVYRAIAVATLNNIIGIAASVSVLAVCLAFYYADLDDLMPHIQFRKILITGVTLLALLAASWLIKSFRKLVRKHGRKLYAQARQVLKHKKRLRQALPLAILLNCLYIVTLLAAFEAIGLSVSFAQAAIALGVGTFLGGILPLPGGLGGVEAGVYFVFTRLGYATTPTLAAVVLYRIVSLWLPFVIGSLALFRLRRKQLL